MAVEIINSGKNIKFDCVDHWLGSDEHRGIGCLAKELENREIKLEDLFETFMRNTEPVKGVINPVRASSIIASQMYEPNSLDFIFIDASHDEMSVKHDLTYWTPRLKENGLIAGDDADSEGVANALNWFFDIGKLDIVGRQWMLNLNKEGEAA